VYQFLSREGCEERGVPPFKCGACDNSSSSSNNNNNNNNNNGNYNFNSGAQLDDPLLE
jgi:hypothetical protein